MGAATQRGISHWARRSRRCFALEPALEFFPFRWNRNGAQGFCFDAFSSREAAQRSTSRENALARISHTGRGLRCCFDAADARRNATPDHVPEKWSHFSDKDMVQLFESARILIDRMNSSDRNTRGAGRRQRQSTSNGQENNPCDGTTSPVAILLLCRCL